MDKYTVPFSPSMQGSLLMLFLLAVSAFSLLSDLQASDFSEKKVLILQSNDRQLKAGELLPASTKVRLAPREVLRVMMPSGEVSKIQGAYSGSIGSALRDDGGSNVNIIDLAKAVVGRGQSRKALGAYRSTGQENGGPRYKESVVRIIVGEKGTYCVAPGQRLALWRPTASKSSFKLTIDAGKIREEIMWSPGESEVSVPSRVVSNKPRRIVLPAQESLEPTRARLWFGEHGDTPGEQLKWYESRGCNVQFESALTFYQTF